MLGIMMMKPNVSRATVIALAVIAVVLTATTFGAITVNQNLSTTGTIITSAGLGTYSDSLCTLTKTSISWGSISPGQNVTTTIYIKNTGSGISLRLNLTTTNWTPAGANGPIAVTWNVEGTTLSPGQSVAATLTLHVSPTITDVDDFSVAIIIAGTD